MLRLLELLSGISVILEINKLNHMDLFYMLFLSLLICDYVKYNTYLKLISVTFVFVTLKCPEEMQRPMCWILNLNPVRSNKKLKLFLGFFSLSVFILYLGQFQESGTRTATPASSLLLVSGAYPNAICLLNVWRISFWRQLSPLCLSICHYVS